MNYADKAAELVLGDRNADYGTPHEDLGGIGLMWTGLLNSRLKPGVAITGQDVALMMTALKLRREAHRPKADNIIDAHGYLLCAEWMHRGVRPVSAGQENWEALEDVCTSATPQSVAGKEVKP
jgi:hypothetical protein